MHQCTREVPELLSVAIHRRQRRQRGGGVGHQLEIVGGLRRLLGGVGEAFKVVVGERGVGARQREQTAPEEVPDWEDRTVAGR